MGSMKKPKRPKRVKMPKPAIKNRASKEERKLTKKISRDLKKKQKQQNRRLERALGACAVLLCASSAVLDVIERNKDKKSV